jgi:serine/threonine-protein kinase
VESDSVTPERESEVARICEAALERTGSARVEFLTEACAGDDALRREVESLLGQESKAAGFMSASGDALSGNITSHGTSFIGRQLGPYAIQSRLGSGGMGEVYRARDGKLRRDVAIKILPRTFTRDPERLARFEREAHMLAALNHPHIGAIYGLEDVDGIPALVLELVEGETLAERLGRASRSDRPGLSVSEALTIAQQIGEALEAAHERGIIHRDLKPANIKITPDGIVKVLDLGLAKATVGGAVSTGVTPSTIDTREGMILGTAAYMSPEQARGQPVDKRTDIWAFGCILYEMLSGRAAFVGETLTDTLAAVIDRDPDWTALSDAATPTVRTVLTRCLDKNPKRRIRDIGDVQIALSGAFDTPKDASAARTPVATMSARLLLSVTATALVATACTAAVLMWLGARPLPRVSRLSLLASDAAAVLPNTGRTYRSLTITPDGTSVVYIGGNSTRLFARALDALEPVEIAAGQEIVVPFVSPDGQWVGYADGGALKKVSLTGGSPIAVAKPTGNVLGATWLPNDTIIFATSDTMTGLQRIPAAGGQVEELSRVDHDRGQADHVWPEALPGGNEVLFTITSQAGGQDAAQIAALDVRNHTQKILLTGGSHAQYVATGHLVYTTGGTLWAVPFDLRKLEVRGTPVRALPRLATTVNGSGQFAVATNGTLVYADAPGTGIASQTLVWVDRAGREMPLGAPTRSYVQAILSPDGARVAVNIAEQNQDLWVWDIERATLGRVTADPANDTAPVWTPDGLRLVFASQRGGVYNIWWQAADGTGTAERLTTNATTQGPTSISPNGRDIVFFELTAARQFDLMRLGLSTMEVSPLLETPFSEVNGAISPDGRWLAYQSNSSGRNEIYVRPFPNVAAGQWVVSKSGGKMPAWSANELFFFDADGGFMRVPYDARSSSWHAGAPSKLLEARYYTGGNVTISRTYDVSRDGQRFLMIKPSQSDSLSAPGGLIVVQHWDQELNARVPAK